MSCLGLEGSSIRIGADIQHASGALIFWTSPPVFLLCQVSHTVSCSRFGSGFWHLLGFVVCIDKNAAKAPHVCQFYQASRQVSGQGRGAASWRPARSAAAQKWMQRFRRRWNLALGRLPAKDILPAATLQAKVRFGGARV